MNIGGKGGNDDSLIAVEEEFIKALSYFSLGSGVSGSFHVCRITHKDQYAFVPQFTETYQIRHTAGNRSNVNFEVTCMHHGADRRLDCQSNSIRNTVVHTDELYRKATDTENRACFFREDLCIVQKIMFFEFQFYQSRSKWSCINRNIQFFQNIWHCTNMVLVPVCDDHGTYAARVVSQIGDIRKNNIDTVHILIRKTHSAINQDQIIPEFNHCHILSDFAKSAQRDYF